MHGVFRGRIPVLLVSIGVMILSYSCIVKEEGEPVSSVNVSTDPAVIAKGEALFVTECSECHDPNSTEEIVGPGLIGILRKPKLPVSNKPATAENIAAQLKDPFKDMPSFEDLPEENVRSLISYLNTL